MNTQLEIDAMQSYIASCPDYREFLLEREEILKHKWHMSRAAGRDIGFEKAHADWAEKHRSAYRAERKKLFPEIYARFEKENADIAKSSFRVGEKL